jgi:hypothetical protein
LRVRATRDDREYLTGVKVSAEEFAAVPIEGDALHGDWNYVVAAR